MLSALRRQNPGEAAPGYGSAKLPSLLPQMQTRESDRCRSHEGLCGSDETKDYIKRKDKNLVKLSLYAEKLGIKEVVMDFVGMMYE